MSVPLSVTVDELVDAAAIVVQEIVGTGVEVVRGQQNRVPTPAGDHVYLTPGLILGLSLPHTSYTDAPGSGEMKLTRPTRWDLQIDVYGDLSQDRATAISLALRSLYGCEALRETPVQPLFTSDPRQIPFVTAEGQYLERWSIDASFQFNPSITVPQQYAERLHVDLIEVDEKYPPGA